MYLQKVIAIEASLVYLEVNLELVITSYKAIEILNYS